MEDCLIEFVSNSAEETFSAGLEIGAHICAANTGTDAAALVIALQGELGSGKTVLAKGITKAFGVKENVTSPTYTIISEYRTDHLTHPVLYHIDVYRLNGDEDFRQIGGMEIIRSGISIIEWSERIQKSLPEDTFFITIEITGPTSRKIRFSQNSPKAAAMTLLALDTAGVILSVAVSRGDKIYSSETEAAEGSSAIIMDFIDQQMKTAGITPGELNGVLCMGGPGSFTGLRIGYSVAKALALSLSIPFVSVPTLDCIAQPYLSQKSSRYVIPLAEARKDNYFYTIFCNGTRIMPDSEASTSELVNKIIQIDEKVVVVGHGASAFANNFTANCKFTPDFNVEKTGYAKELIAIAKNCNLFNNDNNAFLHSGPEYIRKTDAEMNLLENAGNIYGKH